MDLIDNIVLRKTRNLESLQVDTALIQKVNSFLDSAKIVTIKIRYRGSLWALAADIETLKAKIYPGITKSITMRPEDLDQMIDQAQLHYNTINKRDLDEPEKAHSYLMGIPVYKSRNLIRRGEVLVACTMEGKAMEEIRKCPNCESSETYVADRCNCVACRKCRMTSPKGQTEEEAIELWNRLPRRTDVKYRVLQQRLNSSQRALTKALRENRINLEHAEAAERELAALKERTRWRKWPDETPEINRVYQVITADENYRFDYFDIRGGWLSGCDVLYYRLDDHPEPPEVE